MTEREINIAIAELCGWRSDSRNVGKYGALMDGWWTPDGRFTVLYSDIPNYHGNLDAMHDAELRILRPSDWVRYWSLLEPLVCRPNNIPIIFASAAHRAEAFLKVKGKWISTPETEIPVA